MLAAWFALTIALPSSSVRVVASDQNNLAYKLFVVNMIFGGAAISRLRAAIGLLRRLISMPAEVPTVREILRARRGEDMKLNDRFLNPQMGRILRTLGFDKVWRGGEGAHLIDADGERYLDLFGGYGVFAIGRNHPEAIAAVEQVMAARTANLPQLGVTLLSGVLAEQLLARAPGSVAAMVPASSGTEAVEAAIKIARAATGRSRVLYAEHAFHGLTLGSLSLNGNDEFRDGFGPLLSGCDPVPFGDLDALERELEAGDVAAFVLEPIQGKGVNLPPPSYLRAAQERCRGAGALFVCDEVQTGIGRTGRFLALEHWQLEPDIICLAKALSGGLVPVGAVLVSRAAFERVFDGMERAVRHGSTFGGNDLAAAAALATLRVLERERLVERAERLGQLLLELTAPLAERYEVVREVRGSGLMWAIEFGPPSGRAQRSLWDAVERRQAGLFAQLITVPLFHEHKILCQVAGHRMNTIKALPALVVEESEIRRFAAALEETIAAAQRYPSSLARFGVRTSLRALSARR
jgi:ornithine--oxo-acid transaminase